MKPARLPDRLFPIPHRAVFNDVPVNLRTSQRQKLSDYVVQLAAGSLLPVQMVVRDIIQWPLPDQGATQRESRHPFASGQKLELVNATGATARHWSSALNRLCGRTDLADLTLLDFSAVLHDPSGLMARSRRWCPACLQADLDEARPVYERLLWSLRLVTHCPVHGVALTEMCPVCGYRHRHEMMRKSLSGLCWRCAAWLGESYPLEGACIPDASLGERHARWVSRQFASLLELTSGERRSISVASLPVMLDEGIARLYRGNARRFAAHCRAAPSSISEWRAGTVYPSVPTLLRLGWVFHVPLVAWFVADREAWHETRPREGLLDEGRVPVRRVARTAHDWALIGQTLANRAACPSCQKSLAAAAREFGVDPSELRRRFPEPARTIVRKAQLARAEAATGRQQRRRELIETLVRDEVARLAANGTIPTRRTLDAALHARRVDIRRAESAIVRKALHGDSAACPDRLRITSSVCE